MREKIDELIWSILSFGRECSDEWWASQKSSGRPFVDHRRKYLYSLLKEEIKKELLTDEEIIQLIVDWHKEALETNPPKELDIADLVKNSIQAQLQKILKALEEK
ncbi:MAG: hypothetical protein ABSF21_00960 [Dehalococcoidia bacterium]